MAARQTTTKERPQQDQQQQPGPAPQGNLPAAAGGKGPHPLVAFKDYMDQRMGSLVQALPPHITPNAFVSVVLTALQRKPDLLKCTRQSLWNACILAAQDGLLPDGREGAIAPYGESEGGKRVAEIATWMPMVEGYRKKARNSGLISKWEVNVVYAKDVFKVKLGDDASIVHEPYFGAEDRGAVVGAYSIATLTDGAIMRDVMTIREINIIKAKSKAKNGPWSDPSFFAEMARKTMARRHYKQLPHAAEMDRMIERDDRDFGLDDPNSADAIEDRRVRRLTSTSAAFDQFANPGPVIDHDAETGEVRDGETSIDGDDEFADSEAQTTQGNAGQTKAGDQAKPSGNDGRAAAREQGREQTEQPFKPDVPAGQTQQQPQDRPADQKQTAQDKPAEERKQADKPTQTASEGTATSGGDEFSDEERNDRRWPNGETPQNEPEYVAYVKTRLEDWNSKVEFDTGTMKVIGADGISSWWKSKPERDLRSACEVSEQTFHALLADCRARADAIRKGK